VLEEIESILPKIQRAEWLHARHRKVSDNFFKTTLKRLDERLTIQLRALIILVSMATNYASSTRTNVKFLLDFLTTPGDTRATGKSWLLLQFVACNICLSVSQRQSGISNFCPLQFKRFNSFMLVCRKTFGTLRQPPHLGLIYIRLPLLKSSRSEDLTHGGFQNCGVPNRKIEYIM
jgi:hypothetical protein